MGDSLSYLDNLLIYVITQRFAFKRDCKYSSRIIRNTNKIRMAVSKEEGWGGSGQSGIYSCTNTKWCQAYVRLLEVVVSIVALQTNAQWNLVKMVTNGPWTFDRINVMILLKG